MKLKSVLYLLLLCALVFFVFSEGVQKALLSLLFPNQDSYLHSRLSLMEMTATHLLLTFSASLMSALVGIAIGFAVTHGRGRYFSQIIQSFNGLVQTIPPAAIVILAFPVLGFGWPPSLLALFLYSIFPVIANTMVGFYSVSPQVLDAAEGMGMSAFQRLKWVELPLAMPMVLTGLRHSFILNIGTATIAAVIGGGGLGTIIISGLTLQNPALVLSGTIVIASSAILVDRLFDVFSSQIFSDFSAETP